MKTALVSLVLLLSFSFYAVRQLPVLGANALLHPTRTPLKAIRPTGCTDEEFGGTAGMLRGWRCHPGGTPKGVVVYLHGIADNRGSAVGVVARFVSRGFEIVAYDSRGHGESDGDTCTYGFFEKQDVQRVLDRIETRPVILIGQSLGAAVAIQTAAEDRRVAGVVAAETFSDLRTVATERAPFFFWPGLIAEAFTVAERQGHFVADAVSPEAAATRIAAPTLLIHGAEDTHTPPDHSRRVFAALQGHKRLILVPGAAHNGSLKGDVWNEIDQWVEAIGRQ